jgi:hypothetical protein
MASLTTPRALIDNTVQQKRGKGEPTMTDRETPSSPAKLPETERVKPQKAPKPRKPRKVERRRKGRKG